MTFAEIAVELLQAVLLIALAPLMSGIVSKFKALMQGRVGASIFQPYRDLRKLIGKDAVDRKSVV